MSSLAKTPNEPKHVDPPTRRFSSNFSRNKRGIAGTLVWVNFDRHGLLDLVWKLGGQFVANVDDVRPQFNTASSAYLSQSAIFNSTLVRGLPGLPPASASISALNSLSRCPRSTA